MRETYCFIEFFSKYKVKCVAVSAFAVSADICRDNYGVAQKAFRYTELSFLMLLKPGRSWDVFVRKVIKIGYTLAEFGVCERITGLQKLLKSIFLCSKHNSTGILVWPDSVCRQCRTSSAPFSVNLRSRGTTNTSRIHWRPCICRGRSTIVEQSIPPALRLTSKSFSTFKKNLHRFFCTLILFVRTWTLTMLSALAIVRTV